MGTVRKAFDLVYNFPLGAYSRPASVEQQLRCVSLRIERGGGERSKHLILRKNIGGEKALYV